MRHTRIHTKSMDHKYIQHIDILYLIIVRCRQGEIKSTDRYLITHRKHDCLCELGTQGRSRSAVLRMQKVHITYYLSVLDLLQHRDRRNRTTLNSVHSLVTVVHGFLYCHRSTSHMTVQFYGLLLLEILFLDTTTAFGGRGIHIKSTVPCKSVPPLEGSFCEDRKWDNTVNTCFLIHSALGLVKGGTAL